jgi:nicotinamidase-related amidase
MTHILLPCRHYRRYPPGQHQGYTEVELTVDLARSAFLVVDVYGLGYSDDDRGAPDKPTLVTAGSVGHERDVVLNHIVPALGCARRTGLPVVYVSNAAPRVALDRYEFTRQRERNAEHRFETVFAEEKVDPREYTQGDSAFIKYSQPVAPLPDEPFVRKIVYSGFFETRLDPLLRHRRADTLICVGFSLSECLLGTMIDALNRNYRVILLRDCTLATETLAEEERTLAFTKRMILWVETYIGWTATADALEAACGRSAVDVVTPGATTPSADPLGGERGRHA